jgi:hypothetical protein
MGSEAGGDDPQMVGTVIIGGTPGAFRDPVSPARQNTISLPACRTIADLPGLEAE